MFNCKKCIQLENEKEVVLVYKLIYAQGCYGIRIEEYSQRSLINLEELYGVSENREETIHILNLLSENTVTPFVSAEIVDEILSF